MKKMLKRIRYKIEESTNCFICTSHRCSKEEYPVMEVEGNPCGIHRIVWELCVEPNIEGFDIHHTCENRSCINPDHLEKLTRSEHIFIHKSGINGGKANRALTEKQAKKIFLSNKTQKELAKDFNVSKHVISNIKRRKSYKNVTQNIDGETC